MLEIYEIIIRFITGFIVDQRGSDCEYQNDWIIFNEVPNDQILSYLGASASIRDFKNFKTIKF